MQLLQSIKRKCVAGNVLIVLTAITLNAATATGGLAAGLSVGDAAAGGHGGGHIVGGFSGASPVPSSPPIFNPSTPYTVPQSPETPVSPR